MPTITRTISAAHLLRLQTAIGRRLRLVDAQNARRIATPGEVQDYIDDQLKLLVREEEAAARREADAANPDIALT